MGERYSRLNEAERVSIMLLLEAGRGINEIARTLDRAPSTISREVRRQPQSGELRYEATRASAQAHWSRWRCRNRRKLRTDSRLFTKVAQLLRRGWSPAQIAGRLTRMHPTDATQRASHETIYKALYVLPRGELRRELLACLRQGHQNRWPRSRGTNRRDRLPEELRIAARPEEVGARLVPGHWEGDLLKGASNRSAVATLVERRSRLVLLGKMKGSDALSAQQCFERLFNEVPRGLRKSLTYDRGTEMARHAQLSARTGVKVFFADPYAPWQRGSNENANGLVRQYLPKGTDLSIHSQSQLDRIADLLNGRPRKVLDFKTPLEVMAEIMAEQASGILKAKRTTAQRPKRRTA
jgi:transposase, IS30 family